MKHKGFIDIDQSLDKVTQLFADPSNLKEYQDGFIKKVHIIKKFKILKTFYKNLKK